MKTVEYYNCIQITKHCSPSVEDKTCTDYLRQNYVGTFNYFGTILIILVLLKDSIGTICRYNVIQLNKSIKLYYNDSEKLTIQL